MVVAPLILILLNYTFQMSIEVQLTRSEAYVLTETRAVKLISS